MYGRQNVSNSGIKTCAEFRSSRPDETCARGKSRIYIYMLPVYLRDGLSENNIAYVLRGYFRHLQYEIQLLRLYGFCVKVEQPEKLGHFFDLL